MGVPKKLTHKEIKNFLQKIKGINKFITVPCESFGVIQRKCLKATYKRT